MSYMSETLKNDWDDALSVGYNNIDIQHKKLFAIIRQFKDALSLPQNRYKLEIGKILTKLIDYTVYHFSAEEKIMEKYEYPSLAEHAEMHKSFVKKMSDALKDLASGNTDIGNDFYLFLGRWLVEHIAVNDHKWSAFIHEPYPDEEF